MRIQEKTKQKQKAIQWVVVQAYLLLKVEYTSGK